MFDKVAIRLIDIANTVQILLVKYRKQPGLSKTGK